MKTLARLAILALAPTVAGCLADPPRAEVLPSVVLTPSQVRLVQDAVRRDFKDPGSAVFGQMVAGREADGTGYYVCGLVNAKNSFGGYVGAQPYAGMLVEGTRGPAFAVLGVGAPGKSGAILTECYRRSLVPKDVPITAAGGK